MTTTFTSPSQLPTGSQRPQFSVRERLRGKNIIVIGGTGFLGKVWWSFLLHRCEDLGQLYLVVRSRKGLASEQRFWKEIATSESMAGLRARHGDQLDAYFRQKITVLDGDITQPFCGITDVVREQLRGKVDAVVNASGIVDFQPPLDVALEVNAFGVQSLVALARDLGDVPVMHTSTCYVAGYRTGIIDEANPLIHPFPFAGKLERAHWDPDREITECLDIIEQAKHRAGDAFRQSDFLYQASRNLRERGEPATGKVLEDEIERVRRKFVEAQLAELGHERARFWGWPNTYTYTKSIGEQIVARSGLGFCIVRPAIIESCVDFPQRGWNEGINTSAPLIYAIREGLAQMPGSAIRLDVVPCDMVSAGMTLALAELVVGEAKPVYQFGTSDSNPVTMARIYELSGLYKRKHHLKSRKGSAVGRFVQAHVEGALMSPEAFARFGPNAIASRATRVASAFSDVPDGALHTLLEPMAKGLQQFARTQQKIARVVTQFQPFTAELDYEFRCDNTRAALARVVESERAEMCWNPETLDWRSWFLDIHVAGLERWVFPEIEQKLRKGVRAHRRYESLLQMLADLAARFELETALSQVAADGLTRVSYRQLQERAAACAERLQRLGVQPGDRVVLYGTPRPEWAIALFGILGAGAVAVPVTSGEAAHTAGQWAHQVGARLALVDRGASVFATLEFGALSLSDCVAPAPPGTALAPTRGVAGGDTAVLLRNGAGRFVELSHAHLASALAALAPVHAIGPKDRWLTCEPVDAWFQLTWGLLFPLSQGCQIVYPERDTLHSALAAIGRAHVTVALGSPRAWQEFAEELRGRVRERGGIGALLSRRSLRTNRRLARQAGLDVGRFLFSDVHASLGNSLRLLLCVGGAVEESAQLLFAGLGLRLGQGIGFAETAGLLSAGLVPQGVPSAAVGRLAPEVELTVHEPDANGFGELWVRGPACSSRLFGDDAVKSVELPGGWVPTGERGRLDEKGRLWLLASSGASSNTGNKIGQSVNGRRQASDDPATTPAPSEGASNTNKPRGGRAFSGVVAGIRGSGARLKKSTVLGRVFASVGRRDRQRSAARS